VKWLMANKDSSRHVKRSEQDESALHAGPQRLMRFDRIKSPLSPFVVASCGNRFLRFRTML
jgi:hypothetical protein